uniref:Proline rich membrane anchor 1 n=1 Tax=Canis lupus familiaris TaxID=9615 RepID=A0A8P0TRD7_CANLF
INKLLSAQYTIASLDGDEESLQRRWRLRRGARAGAQPGAGGGRGSGGAHVCFPFSCIIYFASARSPAAPAGAPGQRLSRASAAGEGSSGTPAPRAAARRHREGRGPGEARAAGSGRLGGDFPRPPAPPPARPPPRPGPGRGREPPRAAAPCAPRPAPRAGAQLPAPAGQPARPQPRANFCSGARRSSRRSSRRVKPPGARAAARFAPGALVPRAEMLLRDLVLRRGCCWPSLLLHCALHPLWGFVQVTHGEPQKSCSKVADSCPHICQCRPPPLLPPPPPPPPPPRLLSAPAPNSTSCPAEESWWSGLVIIIAVCCASLVFLTVLVIICYKAIKRKPLRKEENGTSVAEYPMTSSPSNKGADVNSAVVKPVRFSIHLVSPRKPSAQP